MIDLENFRDRMSLLSEEDRERKSIQVSGDHLEDALQQASLELGVETGFLDYEILDKGKRNLFGKNRPCLIIAYIRDKEVGEDGVLQVLERGKSSDRSKVVLEPVDGDFTVRLNRDGAYLRVAGPKNGGKAVVKENVMARIAERNITLTEEELLNTTLELGEDLFVRIGDYDYNPINDTMLTISIEEEDMKVYVTAIAPGIGGSDYGRDDLKVFFQNNGVVHGFIEEAIREFENHPVYGQPLLMAQGTPPLNGKDAKIIYNFEVDPSQVKLKERVDGTINFKELNLIQNVVEGQPLARKIPPEAGKDGRTVKGRILPARDGRDKEIGLGKNVTIIDNGRTVIAAASGQVMLVRDKITVETVMVIPGDVNMQTGNVNALGAVLVKGNVEDGYAVTAQGNIEVLGIVGKANLTSGADIIVKKGINGSDDQDLGSIKAGKSVWASFIQNARIDAGELVVVSDGIVNSHITCLHKILCQGKRAQIVGGVIRACEEINASILGSQGGTETILEVGYDPKSKEELETMQANRTAYENELIEVDRNIQGLMRQKKIQRKKLPQEKEKMLIELKDRHNDRVARIKELEEAIAKREEYLNSLKNVGRISAGKTVLPGVKIRIRDAAYDVTRPFDQPVTFLQEEGVVRTSDYEEITEELNRR
ncbi:MAG: FapA family protein [Spirochaetales bacterium]|nr:FapA family protein [Spirochaetales bacterium]